MHGWLAGFIFLISVSTNAAEVSTAISAEELNGASQACLKNFSPGLTATQEGFEGCLRQALDQYYRSLVKAVWGEPKTPFVPPVVVASPPPQLDRSKEEPKLRERVKALVGSARCQRCHVKMSASQFTLAQIYEVLNTPSHREHLGAEERDLLGKLGALLK